MLKKKAMRRRMKNPHRLKLICYSDRMIDINEYLSVFPETKASEMEFNGILLNRMSNN